MHIYFVIFIFYFRVISSYGKQEVPGIAGFISLTGTAPKRLTKIDYYVPIHQPITLNVDELLKRSGAAAEEVGQTYTINTFGLGVCMTALPLVLVISWL